MFTADFAKATAERAIRAFASTLISVWTVAGGILDVRGVDWGSSLGVAGGAALVSILLSIVAGAGVGPPGSPSFVSDPAAAGALPLASDKERTGRPVHLGAAQERKAGGYTGGPPPGPPVT